MQNKYRTRILITTLIISIILSLSLGRYSIPFQNTLGILASQFLPFKPFWTHIQETIVLNLRLPRLILGLLIGAGLASSGAAFQGIFINPLVSPFILGVASGAGFGGVLAMLLTDQPAAIIVSAFFFGLLAILMTMNISHVRSQTSTLMLVLAGMIVSTLFAALTSLLKIIADPIEQLPSIVYWLMGSLATASYTKVAIAAIPILAGTIILNLLRFRINLLSLGDEEARSLGINPDRYRLVIILVVTVIISVTVAVAGIIGWVGLVIPHLARMVVGPDHKILLPVTTILGAIYIVIVDLMSRSITSTEIPIGILTAIIGAIVFAIISRTVYRGGEYDR